MPVPIQSSQDHAPTASTRPIRLSRLPELAVDPLGGLALAVMLNNPAEVSRWLASGADPRCAGSPEETLLMTAAKSGGDECLRLLLPLSDPSARDEDGWQALTWAIHHGSIACARVLLPLTDLSDRIPPLKISSGPPGRAFEDGGSHLDLALHMLRQSIVVRCGPDDIARRERVTQLVADASDQEVIDEAFARASVNGAPEDSERGLSWWQAADALALRASAAAVDRAVALLDQDKARSERKCHGGKKARLRALLPRIAAHVERQAIERAAASGSAAGTALPLAQNDERSHSTRRAARL